MWKMFEEIKSRFDECHFSEQASKIATRSVACGTSLLILSKVDSLVQVSAPSNTTTKVSVSGTAESVGNKIVTNKPASSSALSYAEVARVSPPSAVAHSNQASSPNWACRSSCSCKCGNPLNIVPIS